MKKPVVNQRTSAAVLCRFGTPGQCKSGSRRRAEAALWRAAQAGGLPQSGTLARRLKFYFVCAVVIQTCVPRFFRTHRKFAPLGNLATLPAPLVKKLLLVMSLACLVVGFSAYAQVPAPNHTVIRFHVVNGGTNFGQLDLELFDQEKPETVRNFLMYIYSGAYSNLVLHTLLTNSLLEAGHVRVEDPASTNVFSGYPLWEDFGFITNEYSVGPQISNDFGTIAMVRFPGQTNSASFEWFIHLTNNASFNTNDGGTTVFGRVVNTLDARSGTNLLNYFNTFSSTQKETVFVFEYGEFLGNIPVTMTRPGLPQIADLFTLQPTFIQGGMPRDTNAPTLQVVEPSGDILESTDVSVRFSGTASDNQEVARVLYDSATGRSLMAQGKENWSADVRLIFGTNKISVRSVDYFGNKSPVVERTIVNPFAPLGLTIVGKGKVLGATNGQLLRLGVTNRFEAKPSRGNYFVRWGGDLSSSSRVIEFSTEDLVGDGTLTNVVAYFGKTFLGLSNGTYQGIFYPSSNGVPRSAGWISLSLNSRGQYFGTLSPLGARYQIRGQFDANGSSIITGYRGTTQLYLFLSLGADPGGETISGVYGEVGAFESPLALFRVQKFSSANPAPQAGTYSFLVSPTLDTTTAAGDGYGFGSVTIDASGRIKMNGTLGDDMAIKQTAKLLKYDYWPFFALANGGREAVLGWMRLTSNSVRGDVKWWSPLFPANTNQNASLSMARFSNEVRLVNWTNGTLTLSGGGLTQPISSDVTLNEDGSLTVLSNTNNVQFGLADERGQISGSFTHPGTGELTPLQGAALQSSNIIGGFFGDKDNNGAFVIRPRP